MATSTPLARISLRAVPNTPAEAWPFVKWVGGKGRILSQLRPLLPRDVDRRRHVEPFIGGGALFFSRRPARALLADVNPALIETYTAIQQDVEGVIRTLRQLAARHTTERYYEVRASYNLQRRSSPTRRAAMFIYLNKTCFNGLHRVNQRGEFNVPVGRYKNPRILNPENLRGASQALQGAAIREAGFEELLDTAKPNDFVYFDPPYEPVSQTASFTSYARDGFTREDQTRLRNVYAELDQRGCKVMLSNSDVPFIRKLYSAYNVTTVAAPRAINCDAKKRGRVSEVVVRNYH